MVTFNINYITYSYISNIYILTKYKDTYFYKYLLNT